MQRITYSRAPTAAGKTHLLAERATKLSKRGHRVVIASPTQELCDKTDSDELRNHAKHPRTYVIHSGAVGEGQVQKALIKHFKDRPEGGHITLITHAALTQLPSWLDVSDMHLIVDEELSVVKHTRLRIPETHHLLTDQIEVEPHSAVYGKIGLVDGSVTETLARNEQGDELLAKIRESLWTLLNEYSETFVNLEQFAKLKSGDYQMLNFHSLLLPSVVDRFASVFMAAANFESTPLFKIWPDKGVTFERDEKFTDSLRYKNHENGKSLDIYYYHERNWSKRLARKPKRPDSDQTVLDAMLEHSYGMLGEQPFLVHVNKGTSLPTNANAVELPSKPHGSNRYSHIHNVVCLAATNLKPDDARFMESLGFNRDEITESLYLQQVYQTASRTSLRNIDDKHPKVAIVANSDAAQYLQFLYSGARIHKIDAGFSDEELAPRKPGRSKQYGSSAEKSRASRARARKKKAELLLGQFRFGLSSDTGTGNNLITDVETADLAKLSLAGTLYGENIQDTRPLAYVAFRGDDQLITDLRDESRRLVKGKSDNQFISPAVFKPERRRAEDILYLRHVWLDFDNGELSPGKFPSLFPHVKMLITNTYSHTHENPRYRVVMFTKGQMTSEAYKAIFDLIVAKLKDAGYWVNKNKNSKRNTPPRGLKPSGLDWSKRTPTSLFYLPVQAQKSEDSFFNVYDGEGRKPIDVEQWIRNSTLAVEPDRSVVKERSNRKVDADAVQSAIDLWRQSSQFPGEGNTQFFNLALSLRKAGMGHSGIRSCLEGECQFGRSPDKRRRQIPSIMDWLGG